MKLKSFTPENSKTDRSHSVQPALNIRMANGLFSLNRTANDRIGLKVGDSVILHQDEEDPENWYIEKAPAGEGFKLISRPASKNFLFFNNTKVAKELAASLGFSGKSARMLLAGQQTETEDRKIWGIIPVPSTE